MFSKLFKKKTRKLPENWVTTYLSLLKNLSGKMKNDPEAKKGMRVLKKLNQELYTTGRGEAFLPQADKHGLYPTYEDPPYAMLQRAIRANTGKVERARAWKAIEASGKVTKVRYPKSTLDTLQQKRLLAAAEIAFPQVKGKVPHLLGRKVPGENSRSGAVLRWGEFDPSDM